MLAPGENRILNCEQCGAPLSTAVGAEGCLNCLLSAGIAPDDAEEISPPFESGTRFYQHYEILTRPDGSRWELGRGAMGVTYKARDVNLNTPVALKIINARFSARPDARGRFLHEAQAAAQLRHPNVASVYHFGTVNQLPDPSGGTATPEENADAGDCFYTMEFIEGETLEARLRRDGPLLPVLALEVGLQVARALAAAEKRGLVHRDLKPANIMLAAEEEEETSAGANGHRHSGSWVKVIDFGLAKLAQVESEPGPARRFLGTPAFSSPEQRETRTVDARSDTYSLGATLYYALTGKALLGFRSSSSAISGEPAREPLVLNGLMERGIPRTVISLLQSLLASDPKDRPQSAAELQLALQRSLDDLTSANHQVTQPFGRGRRWAMTGGLVLAAALIGSAIYVLAPSPTTAEKSIAVLPFRNLGGDPTNAFFADGVQDDILSRLGKIRDLKVISRLGTSRYAADRPRDFRAIGRTLGVRHLLEGSLRRENNRVRLDVSLVDARDGHEVWSETYDRKLADAIDLQGELASDVADALDVKLTPHERLDVRSKATRDPEAYVLYLQALKLEKNPAFEVSAYGAAEVLYSKAVAVDPAFALAHARLATTLGLLYRFRAPSEELKVRAHAEAREALRLQPDLAEAHLAHGLCFYRIDRDFAQALPELETAQRLLPNDTEAEITIAFIHRRRGEWRAARTGQEHALARDPLVPEYEHELHATACLLRDWPAAAAHADRALALAPQMEPLKGERALVGFWQNGDLSLMRKFFSEMTGYGDVEGNLAWERWDAAMLGRDFSTAHAAIDSFPFETLPSVLSAPVPKSYLEGCIWLAQGEDVKAAKFFEMARPSMEAETLAHPEAALRHARLGLLYAYMGRKADAIREGEWAVELTPVSDDAIDGHQWLCNLALIHARVGDAEEAISMIAALLREPGCVLPLDEESLSLWDLRMRWQWDPLRNDPRFQKILAEPEPPTIF